MITFTIPKGTIIKVNGIDATAFEDVTFATGFRSQQELSEHLRIAGLWADCIDSITEPVTLGAGRIIGESPRYDEPLTDSTGKIEDVSFADVPTVVTVTEKADEGTTATVAQPTKKKTKKGK